MVWNLVDITDVLNGLRNWQVYVCGQGVFVLMWEMNEFHQMYNKYNNNIAKMDEGMWSDT